MPQCSGFPCGSAAKKSACNAGDLGPIPGLGRSPGEGNDNPLQHSGLENSMDRGAWQATDHGATKERHYWVTEHAQLAHTILFKRVSPKMLIAEGWYDSVCFLEDPEAEVLTLCVTGTAQAGGPTPQLRVPLLIPLPHWAGVILHHLCQRGHGNRERKGH